jgi:hypothetical protein
MEWPTVEQKRRCEVKLRGQLLSPITGVGILHHLGESAFEGAPHYA